MVFKEWFLICFLSHIQCRFSRTKYINETRHICLLISFFCSLYHNSNRKCYFGLTYLSFSLFLTLFLCRSASLHNCFAPADSSFMFLITRWKRNNNKTKENNQIVSYMMTDSFEIWNIDKTMKISNRWRTERKFCFRGILPFLK